jgi:hypothetical protein
VIESHSPEQHSAPLVQVIPSTRHASGPHTPALLQTPPQHSLFSVQAVPLPTHVTHWRVLGSHSPEQQSAPLVQLAPIPKQHCPSALHDREQQSPLSVQSPPEGTHTGAWHDSRDPSALSRHSKPSQHWSLNTHV